MLKKKFIAELSIFLDYFLVYLGPNQLIAKLHMHFSSRRNILRH
jgi:hypothetical protein